MYTIEYLMCVFDETGVIEILLLADTTDEIGSEVTIALFGVPSTRVVPDLQNGITQQDAPIPD